MEGFDKSVFPLATSYWKSFEECTPHDRVNVLKGYVY